jgi:hypothetical protein
MKTHIPFTLKPFFKSCEFDGIGQQVDPRLMLLVKERGEEKGSVERIVKRAKNTWPYPWGIF